MYTAQSIALVDQSNYYLVYTMQLQLKGRLVLTGICFFVLQICFFSPYLAANCNLIPLLDGYVTRQCVISNTSIYLCDQRLRQRQPDGSGFFALDADADADASSIMRHLPCMA